MCPPRWPLSLSVSLHGQGHSSQGKLLPPAFNSQWFSDSFSCHNFQMMSSKFIVFANLISYHGLARGPRPKNAKLGPQKILD